MINVKTSYPVIVKGKVVNNTKRDYSNLDGGSSSASITAFQKWFNTNKGGSLAVDGVWGPNTQAAWTQAGIEYDKSWANTILDAQGLNVPSGGGATPTEAQPKSKRTKGKLGAKIKNAFSKLKNSGKVDQAKDKAKQLAGDSAVGQQLGLNNGPAAPEGSKPADVNLSMPVLDSKPGMSKNVKIGLGVAGAALVIFLLYKLTSGSKTTNAGK